MKTLINRWIASLVCACAVVLNAKAAEPTVLFSTGFETSEGYTAGTDLAGQNGWLSFGTTSIEWNGVVADLFEGWGQQAYIGFTAPADGQTVVSLYKPALPSIPANQRVVKFSTFMAILDSTNERYDDFRWTVYNADVERLLTLDFDNHALEINYSLDNANGFISTGQTFEPNRIYELVIIMDTARNRWSARLDDIPLVTEQPMTTTGASLALGDVDAVWAIRDQANPGNNYMAFDDYSIVAYSAIPPKLLQVSHPADGSNLVRLIGEPNRPYVLEVTSNFQTWTPIKTNTPPNGIFEHSDLSAIGQPIRFYRARVQ